MLKYKYIFQIKYTEAILSSSTLKLLLWFEISKTPIAVKKTNLLCRLLQFSAHFLYLLCSFLDSLRQLLDQLISSLASACGLQFPSVL